MTNGEREIKRKFRTLILFKLVDNRVIFLMRLMI